MKTVCPVCRMKMIRGKYWFEQGQLIHGCNYCYLRFRTKEIKRRRGEWEESDSDDIL